MILFKKNYFDEEKKKDDSFEDMEYHCGDYEFSDDLQCLRYDLNTIKNRVIERIEDYGYQHILIAKEVKPYNILEYEYNLKNIIKNNKKVKEELIKASKNDFIIYTALKTMNIIEDINK